MKSDNMQGIIFKEKAPNRVVGPVIRLRRNLQDLMHIGRSKTGNPDGILSQKQIADIHSRLRSK